MAEAKALFAKHYKLFCDFKYNQVTQDGDRAIIYAACIIAEAIRNEQDSVDMEMKIPTAA